MGLISHYGELTYDKQKKKYLNGWTSIEEQILDNLFSNHSNSYISEVLNKSEASIARKAYLLGLKKSETHRSKISKLNNKNKHHAWTEKEVTFLIENYNSKSYNEIADSLNRTKEAVSQKARNLKLKKYRKTIKEIQDEANLKFPFIKDSNI